MSIIQKIRDALIGAFSLSSESAESTGFKALGNGYWLAFFTNNFMDRDGEILSSKAQAEYVTRVQHGLVPMPELWAWHTKGTRFGQALYVDRLGHMTYAVGRFDDTPAAQQAEKALMSAPRGRYTLSHGFTYPRWAKDANGIYHAFNTFEITVLPRGKEANIFTTIEAVKELNDMPLDTDKKQLFGELFGEYADDIIRAVEAGELAGKALAEANVAFKDFAELTTGKAEEDDETPDAETQETVAAPAADDDEEKALKALVADVIESQAVAYTDVLDAIKARDAVIRSFEQTVKALQADIARMAALLEVKAEPASTAAKTVAAPAEAEVAKQAIDAKRADATPETVEALLFGASRR